MPRHHGITKKGNGLRRQPSRRALLILQILSAFSTLFHDLLATLLRYVNRLILHPERTQRDPYRGLMPSAAELGPLFTRPDVPAASVAVGAPAAAHGFPDEGNLLARLAHQSLAAAPTRFARFDAGRPANGNSATRFSRVGRGSGIEEAPAWYFGEPAMAPYALEQPVSCYGQSLPDSAPASPGALVEELPSQQFRLDALEQEPLPEELLIAERNAHAAAIEAQQQLTPLELAAANLSLADQQAPPSDQPPDAAGAASGGDQGAVLESSVVAVSEQIRDPVAPGTQARFLPPSVDALPPEGPEQRNMR